MASGSRSQIIGVDIGGTFTDAVVVAPDGRVGVSKASTVHGRLASSVLESIDLAAATIGQSGDEAIAKAGLIGHGTTVGVNTLLTGSGVRVGLLTTAGFESTLPIARANNTRGLDEECRYEALRWEKPPLLVDRHRIVGIPERIDAAGTVIEPLDEDAVRIAARRFAHEDVEAVAIAMLWSVANPAHERRAGEIVSEELPQAFLTLSSDLSTRVGEYERTTTAVLNAYVGPLTAGYLSDLEKSLRDRGFSGTFFLLQIGGGMQLAGVVGSQPIRTFNSGPVGGLAAAARTGELLGHENIISTDVGGTSFDVGLVIDGRVPQIQRPMIGRHDIAIPVADVVSVGTGGGSVATVDRRLRRLRVGPRSAGAHPGPACYGRGGLEPTVTDAAVVLGYLARLGSSVELDRDAAERAVQDHVAGPLGIDVAAAAEGMLRIANVQMANLIRRATIMRGHDPSHFVLYAYGGAAPQHVGRYAGDVGIELVVIPSLAATFSAYGAVSSDLTTRIDAELEPRGLTTARGWIEDRIAGLQAQAVVEARSSLPGDADVRHHRFAGIRFKRQVHDLQIALPDGPLGDDLVPTLGARFAEEYERLVGRGTTSDEVDLEIVSLAVETRTALDLGGVLLHATDALAAPVDGSRSAHFDGALHDTPVLAGSAVGPSDTITGPAFVELPTTTIVVYPGESLTVDELGNYLLHLEGRRHG